jgi:hypothetical protein
MFAVKNVTADKKSKTAKMPNKVKSLWKNSSIEYIINMPTSADVWVYLKYFARCWALNLKLIIDLPLKLGLVGTVRTLKQNPWMLTLLNAPLMMRRFGRGKTGRYHESICMTVYNLVDGVTDLLKDMFFYPERLVIIEDLLPPDIVHAMGLKAYQLEAMGIMLPMVKHDAALQYIDDAENEGINPDSCSLPKTSVGMVIRGHMPKGLAIVSSNLPCDAGLASYAFFQRAYNVPIYRVDVPYHFFNERAEKLFAEDVKGMIAFLEKHTPGRMDWDRFREFCTTRNRMLEMEMELWEMLRSKPAPLAAEAVFLSHLWHYNVTPEYEASAKQFENLVALARENIKENIPATEDERYRAVLWNPPFLHFPDIFNWAERTYGVTLLMDSMSYHHHDPIDTSTPESMLRGWSRIVMQGPMVRHTRGPAENYLDDIFRSYKQFNLDMVWVANHVGCKSGQGMNGILRERCREQGIPLLILDYDLSDPRIVSHDNMIRQMEHFMDNVMKAPRLN